METCFDSQSMHPRRLSLKYIHIHIHTYIQIYIHMQVAIGLNGIVWMRCSDMLQSLLIKNAISNCNRLRLDDIQTEAMTEALVKQFKKRKQVTNRFEFYKHLILVRVAVRAYRNKTKQKSQSQSLTLTATTTTRVKFLIVESAYFSTHTLGSPPIPHNI